MSPTKKIIKDLDLQPHPEGGYFKETYRSAGKIGHESLSSSYDGDRNYSTCIYFMLTSGTFSAFHKINQDEIWHFYDGSPVKIHTISEIGEYSMVILGRDFNKNEKPQYVVPGNCWFAAHVEMEDSHALVGCTVAPGFDFRDFLLPKREVLLSKFPEHRDIINQFTRE